MNDIPVMLPGPPRRPNDNRSDQQTGDGPRRDSAEESPAGSGPKRRNIRSLEECVAALGELPGLIVMNVLTPAKANAMTRSLREVMRYHETRQSHAANSGQLPDADLLRAARENPEVLNLLASVLTDEQISLILQGGGDG